MPKNFPLKCPLFSLFFLFTTLIFAQSKSLVVIDSEYSNKDQVLNSIPTETVLLLLDAHSNPWKTIRESLESNSEIKTIHLFVEANYNSLTMGGITYDSSSINNEFELSMLEGLYQGANFQLLIYNCNLGSNPQGIALLNGISQKAYLNIGVSTNCTSIFDEGFNFNFSTLNQLTDNPITTN